MKAVYYDGKDAFYREDYPVPKAGEQESLVQILLSAVCNTDKEVLKGYKPDFTGVMGHEFVGKVITSSDPSLVGKRVVGELNEECGHCIYCKTGRPHHCSNRRVIGLSGRDGCFAEYMTIATRLLHVVPDSLPTQIAIFTEPLAAALEILNQVHVRPDLNAAVIGDGRLALFVAQALALNGIDLTVIGRHPEKLENFSHFARTVTQGEKEGYELVVDATGSPSGLADAMNYVRKKGTIVIKSTYAGNASINMSQAVVNELTIVGSRCGPFEPALKLLETGRVQLPPIQLYDLEEFREAVSAPAFKAVFSF